MRRVYKTRTFSRWARKLPLPDELLCAAVTEMAAGLVDADLGRHVYKKRVALPGRGKRGGVRVPVGSNITDRWFFVYGFAKNERATVDDRELAVLRKVVAALLELDTERLERAIDGGELTEICREEESHTR